MIATPDLAGSEAHLRDMIAVADRLLEGIAGHLRQRETRLSRLPDSRTPCCSRTPSTSGAIAAIPGRRAPSSAGTGSGSRAGVLEALARLNIDYAYPRELFIEQIEGGNGIYHGGYGHFTALGHELSARLLADRLAEVLIVRTDPGTS